MLKLMEDHTVRRMGSVRDQAVNIQVLSATNRDLSRMVAEGRFREDLYYRLNTLTVEAPPLRERGQDPLVLARHFVADLGARYGKPGLRLDVSAEAAILEHVWPGNVRELRNAMEQAVLYSTGSAVRALDLPLPRAGSTGTARLPVAARPVAAEATPPSATLVEVERALIARTLGEVDGNVSKAARRLGITRDQLRYRIEKFGLAPKD